MKFLLITLLFTLSTSVSAMDFNKVTGTFDVSQDKKSLTTQLATSETFDVEENQREPASTEKEEKVHVTELTGSFK